MLACIESPQPGVTTTAVVSAADAISTSIWPTPTVSMITTPMPAAPSNRTASGTARDRPPRCPRVAMERMKTVGSSACWFMRTRSPRIAPPLNGDVGSTASTPTCGTDSGSAAAFGDAFSDPSGPSDPPTAGHPPRTAVISPSVNVDFPDPGAPVNPRV